MSIVRVERRSGFTTIPNAAVRDSRLSFRARGVLAELLSRPDWWVCRSTELVARGKEGRDAIRAALRELEDAGYLLREREQNERGQWVTTVTVRDHAEGAVDSTGEVTEDGFPGVGESTAPKPGNPAPGEPGVKELKTDRRKTLSRATGVPDDFLVTADLREWAREQQITVDLDAETEQFLDHHRARGSTFKDWTMAWRTWMRNTKRFRSRSLTADDGGADEEWTAR